MYDMHAEWKIQLLNKLFLNNETSSERNKETTSKVLYCYEEIIKKRCSHTNFPKGVNNHKCSYSIILHAWVAALESVRLYTNKN